MKFTATQIANFLDGEIFGDQHASVSKIAKIEEACEESISFLSNAKYTNYLYTTKAGIVIINKNFTPDKKVAATLIKVDDAYQSFSKILRLINQNKEQKLGIENPNYISEDVVIPEDVYIGAFAYINKNAELGKNVKIYPHVFIGEGVSIGEGTIIFSGAKIYEGTKIGKNCIIHAQVIIGSDGFGFAPQDDHTYRKIPQLGNVIIGDYVEIGANTSIDRATMGSTIIKNGVKLDNLIQIAHNVEIGENTVIAAQTGIAGSVKIGKNCVFGGQVGISGHINIGDNVKIQAQSGISKNLKDGAIVQGSPAFEYNAWNKSYVYFKNLPGKFRNIEKEIKKLNND